MYRLAVVTSHPIQYQAPWFRALALVSDLEVFFCHRQDGAGQAAAGFGVDFEWDVPLLEGYSHQWLENRSVRPDVSKYSGCDTPEIGRLLRSGGFDAVIVCGWYLKSYVQAIMACKRAGIPVLVRGDSHMGTPRSRLARTLKYLPYRSLLRFIDAHLYVGEANRVYLKHYGVPESRLFFAPHFVDNEFFASRARNARERGRVREIRHELGIPSNAVVFAVAGKLVPQKRYADFIRAIAAAGQAGSSAWGLVIGSGPLLTELEELAASLDARVRFAGFRNQKEMPEFLAAADVLVVTSESETWGLAVNEAMACGLPAIVNSSTGCAVDLIEHGKTGCVCPTSQVASLAGEFVKWEGQIARNGAVIRAGVEAKMALYTCEVAVRGTLAALGTVLAGRSPRWRFDRAATRLNDRSN